MLVEGVRVLTVIWRVLHLPRIRISLGIQKDHIVKSPEVCRSLSNVAVGGLPSPNNLIYVAVSSENFIKHGLHVMRDVLSNVDIYRARFGQEFPEQKYRLVKPIQVRIKPASPCIPVGLLFNQRRLLGEEDLLVVWVI